jgi:hypothetical protein
VTTAHRTRFALPALLALAIALSATLPAAAGESKPWEPKEMVVGTLPLDDFATVLPAWQERADRFVPYPDVIELLKGSAPAEIDVIFGSWCSDSYEQVPYLVTALKAAGNPSLTLTLIGVDRQKEEPEGRGKAAGVKRVPTIVVKRQGEEIGRVIETPSTATLDRDVAMILNGIPLPPKPDAGDGAKK